MGACLDLSAIGPGFSDPDMASQAVFRRSLEALSRPGSLIEVDSDAAAPAGVGAAACALLLALPDQDTRLWLAPSFSEEAAAYFRFHTGCPITSVHGEADFALAGDVTELPLLQSFRSGSDEYPDHSAALIVEVPHLAIGSGWRIAGPGIRNEARLSVPALEKHFPAQWAANHKRFPRGIDVFFTCGALLCGLPRTIQLSED